MKRGNNTFSLNPNRHKTGLMDRAPAQKRASPSGPLKPGVEGRAGSLLLFVPRNTISTVIDKMTGGYGYSHLAIDCGEVDVPSGKRVMIESTPGLGVHNAFQDEYGDRKFIRIPLEETGIPIDEFCDCVRSKLGEKYDGGEALTLGLLTNPVRQMCSDLAIVCLPKEMRIDIARQYTAGLLHPFSAVRTYGKLDKTFHLFVSPNGFSQYFGAPRGKKVDKLDQVSEPIIRDRQRTSRDHSPYWITAALAILCGLAFIWLLTKFSVGSGKREEAKLDYPKFRPIE